LKEPHLDFIQEAKKQCYFQKHSSQPLEAGINRGEDDFAYCMLLRFFQARPADREKLPESEKKS